MQKKGPFNKLLHKSRSTSMQLEELLSPVQLVVPDRVCEDNFCPVFFELLLGEPALFLQAPYTS